MLYLYAFAAEPAALPPVAGIEGSALAAERMDGIEAIVSTLEVTSVEPSEEAVLAHARVVDGLTATNAAVLPARFGRAFANAGSLRAAVRDRAADLEAALERVKDCVELSVRVFAPAADEASPADPTGRAYMVARLEERRRAQALADEIDAPLSALAQASSKSILATPQLLLSGVYLVRRADVDDFRGAVADVEGLHRGLALACTGPWPPYSFATAEAEPQ